MSHPEPNLDRPIGPDQYPIDRVIEVLDQTGTHAQVIGATGAFAACVMADLSHRIERPLIIVATTSKAARAIARDLELFTTGVQSDSVALYPEYDVGPYHGSAPDRKLTLERLTTVHRLASDAPPRFVVTSIRSAMRRTVPFDVFQKVSRVLRVNDEVDNAQLRELMHICGYTEVDLVEDPGTFAIRGDIVDVYSPLHEHPVRFERWGDDIAEMRAFDRRTQRTVGQVDHVEIFPIREAILTPETVSHAKSALRKLGDERTIPTRRINDVVQDLEAGLHGIGFHALLPAFYGQLGDLFDHAPDNALVVLVDPDQIVAQAVGLDEKRHEEAQAAIADSELVFGYEAYYRGSSSIIGWLKEHQRLEFRRLAIEREDNQGFPPPPEEQSFTFRARPNTDVIQLRKHHGGVDETVRALKPQLETWKELFGRICIAVRTRGQADRLESLLRTIDENSFIVDPPVDVTEPVPPPAGLIEIYISDVGEGFRSEILSLCLISGHELFGSRVVSSTSASLTEHASISHFRDLTPGDHVVHVDFGIGRYQGLVHLEVEGIGNDFLHIEYAGKDKLYLPVYRLGRVQRYIGGGEGIRLDKLGGTSWERTKEKVKENIREVASDLLKLYAERELRKGHAFAPPDAFYREFEDAFPFEETPDQAQAIYNVLSDMTRERPMDRLICGDVGFGKTEVAIRAAMKAALDGKQVAVLVPTTILCEQHLISFRRRCEEFGIRVEALSRFRTSKETKAITEATAEGKVDILLGTHRLLGKKIEYRNLGLLVVDEEQRFGVTHKEKIKQLKANIDVLTLTATPIPRTLQMSLLGIRDLSIIATPPHDRLAVRTHLAKFNDSIIREAIMREIGRGGQVFFVHNRVQTIEEMKEHLEKVVPEARIAIAHGQMNEADLEKVMVSYVRGETNVLLASSIIESGLDIPNANTILINRADNFGLSQLYQLRGRVGRGKERAFAYLLVPARTKVTPDAEKRLEAIMLHTELGSGFQVATYDLEIRGAGNLLGDDQSGHVAAVGLDLYTELLEEAIDEIRGTVFDDDIEPEVNVPIEAFIPEEYIPATSLRLMFYKRFSLSTTTDELYETFGELTDRFGDPPESVKNLRDIIELKVRLRGLKAKRFDAGPSSMSMELLESTPIQPAKLLAFISDTRGKMRLTKDMKLIYKFNPDESANVLRTAHDLMETLRKLC